MLGAARLVVIAGHDDGTLAGGGLSLNEALGVEGLELAAHNAPLFTNLPSRILRIVVGSNEPAVVDHVAGIQDITCTDLSQPALARRMTNEPAVPLPANRNR